MSVLSMFGRNIGREQRAAFHFESFQRSSNERTIDQPKNKRQLYPMKRQTTDFTSASSTLVPTTTNEEVSETAKSRLSSWRLVYDEMHLARCNECCNDNTSRSFFLSHALYLLLARCTFSLFLPVCIFFLDQNLSKVNTAQFNDERRFQTPLIYRMELA